MSKPSSSLLAAHNTTSAVARDRRRPGATVSRTPDAARTSSPMKRLCSAAHKSSSTPPPPECAPTWACAVWTWQNRAGSCTGRDCTTPIRRNSSSGPKGPRTRGCGRPRDAGGAGRTPPNTSSAGSSTTRQGDRPHHCRLRRDMLNVALIGMPSSGGKSVGRALAEKLSKKFIDLGRRSSRPMAAASTSSPPRARTASVRESAQTARFAKGPTAALLRHRKPGESTGFASGQ